MRAAAARLPSRLVPALAIALAACGGSAGGSQIAVDPAPPRPLVLGANDLGMHCVDREFSVFSILPPFNVVHAQLLVPDAAGRPHLRDDSDHLVTYEAVGDARGSINSTSLGKSDFWTHAAALYGVTLAPGESLTGLYMPADGPNPGPQSLTYEPTKGHFTAFGIPILPVDDAGAGNTYPLLRLVARYRSNGEAMARLDVVVPVAKETDCSNCHATGGIAAADPAVTWSAEADRERQTKINVLRLHDARIGTTLEQEQPVLCARCHYSAALDLQGTGPQGQQVGRPSLSVVMHGFHGGLTHAGAPVFPPGGTALQTCYQCHPGAITRCLRGAMANAGLECLQCHGDMAAVGADHYLLPGGSLDGQNDGGRRRPWVDLPRCQSCHTGDAVSHATGADLVFAQDGLRLRQAWRIGDAAASPLLATNRRFAEGVHQRYRDSKGHGGIDCAGCHGSTHAEWPNADPAANDNVAARELQGHTGMIADCAVCHAPGTLPADTLAGPHGLHLIGDQRFVGELHGNLYRRDPAACKACHGADLRGTALSRAKADRVFAVEDHGTRAIAAGTPVGCSLCH